MLVSRRWSGRGAGLGVLVGFIVGVVVDLIVGESPSEDLDDAWGLDGDHGSVRRESLWGEGVLPMVQHALGVVVRVGGGLDAKVA